MAHASKLHARPTAAGSALSLTWHVLTTRTPTRPYHSRYRTPSSASRRPRIETTKNHCATPTWRRAGPPSGDPTSAACVPQRQKWPIDALPPGASQWTRGAESSSSGPAKGSSKRMPSAVGGLVRARAHVRRTDRPMEEGRAMRAEGSVGALDRVRCAVWVGTHRHRIERGRLGLGRPLLLAA